MTKFQTFGVALLLLLLTWGLRLCCLADVPPGWRDDELINIHALSGELLAGRFPLYFTGASGHEPLYHYLHAGVHAVLGFNVLSGHVLSVAFGTLTVALTYALAHRLFRRTTAVIASLALAFSFWSLMYSRAAIRHMGLPPFALAAFCVLWRSMSVGWLAGWNGGFTHRRNAGLLSAGFAYPLLVGLLLGAGLYTYPAARVLPVLLVLFAAYLALIRRDLFSQHWRGFLVAILAAGILAVPLGVSIAQGRSEAAVQGIGADARLAELAVPLRELWAGDPRPLLQNAWTTLGMFHATGDPEWLYNLPDRPVFNVLGGALLWAGVALCLYRWRQPRYFFLLLWLGLGLLPAFVSSPPASLSHTILAQPVAYILPALALTEIGRWVRSPRLESAISRLPSAIRKMLVVVGPWSLVGLFLVTNASRDLRDYFVVWPQRGMVRLLYRADYRQAAGYLDTHPEVSDVAISSNLMGPWDRLALGVDTQRHGVSVRLFNPERALVWVEENAPSTVLLTSSPRPESPIDGFLEASAGLAGADLSPLSLYVLPASGEGPSAIQGPLGRFANGLALVEAQWVNEGPLALGEEAVLLTTWLVAAPLDLPPIPVVANPPPPGVYSGPRLAVFAHLLSADGTFLVGDDGLWVDPLTLRPGDRFCQAHRFTLPPDAPAGPYTVELGLYDPMTGERWAILDSRRGAVSCAPSADRLLITGEGGGW